MLCILSPSEHRSFQISSILAVAYTRWNCPLIVFVDFRQPILDVSLKELLATRTFDVRVMQQLQYSLLQRRRNHHAHAKQWNTRFDREFIAKRQPRLKQFDVARKRLSTLNKFHHLRLNQVASSFLTNFNHVEMISFDMLLLYHSYNRIELRCLRLQRPGQRVCFEVVFPWTMLDSVAERGQVDRSSFNTHKCRLQYSYVLSKYKRQRYVICLQYYHSSGEKLTKTFKAEHDF